jgi:hypothetical protein
MRSHGYICAKVPLKIMKIGSVYGSIFVEISTHKAERETIVLWYAVFS